MATGFSVMDALNKNSKAGVDESPRARFRTKDISIFKMYRNKLNFYYLPGIEELAGDILMYGLKQNLEVVFEPSEQGEYRIVAGERRWLEEFAGLEDGYCIMATSLMNENGEPFDRADLNQICADIRANGDGYIDGGEEYIMIENAVGIIAGGKED